MTISQPRQDGQYPDRGTHCKQALGLALQDLIERVEQQGWEIPETLDAIAELIAEFRIAHQEDPDPSADPNGSSIL
ncbi:MAG: hypothetical protein EON58_10385 [Alphaproteobacteria bacterium]|nr:MAG: hypothetical protein EON58_10385 [Alphaproteobacteria bacterium]